MFEYQLCIEEMGRIFDAFSNIACPPLGSGQSTRKSRAQSVVTSPNNEYPAPRIR
jgi:hypothetical protein